jgi:hypothetical protein
MLLFNARATLMFFCFCFVLFLELWMSLNFWSLCFCFLSKVVFLCVSLAFSFLWLFLLCFSFSPLYGWSEKQLSLPRMYFILWIFSWQVLFWVPVLVYLFIGFSLFLSFCLGLIILVTFVVPPQLLLYVWKCIFWWIYLCTNLHRVRVEYTSCPWEHFVIFFINERDTLLLSQFFTLTSVMFQRTKSIPS